MPRTRLCDLLGIEHPIVSAPMAGTATAGLAAAVSAAGGFGLIGGSDSGGNPEHPEWLRDQIRAARRLTDRPFGVGFVLSFPMAAELTEVALAEGVAAVAYSFGDAASHLARAGAAGVATLVQVQTLAQARAAVAAGADVVVGQGAEGGGHVGEQGTMSFVPAVVDAVGGVPVLAAGGIGDGRGLAAALMLGAAGAWIGTRFLASAEWAGGEWRKGAVVAAGADDTVRTRAYDVAYGLAFPDGVAGRVLRGAFTETWHGRPEGEIVAARERLREEREAAEAAGDKDAAPVWAGSAAGLIGSVEPAGAIVRRIAAEADRLLREGPPEAQP